MYWRRHGSERPPRAPRSAATLRPVSTAGSRPCGPARRPVLRLLPLRRRHGTERPLGPRPLRPCQTCGQPANSSTAAGAMPATSTGTGRPRAATAPPAGRCGGAAPLYALLYPLWTVELAANTGAVRCLLQVLAPHRPGAPAGAVGGARRMMERTCRICGRLSFGVQAPGRACSRCAHYWRRHGTEWAPNPRPCRTCGQLARGRVSGQCVRLFRVLAPDRPRAPRAAVAALMDLPAGYRAGGEAGDAQRGEASAAARGSACGDGRGAGSDLARAKLQELAHQPGYLARLGGRIRRWWRRFHACSGDARAPAAPSRSPAYCCRCSRGDGGRRGLSADYLASSPRVAPRVRTRR